MKVIIDPKHQDHIIMKTPDEKVIQELNRKLSISIAKNTQLEQEVIELKESKEELLEVLNLIILNEVALEGEGKTCSIPGPIYLKALQAINKAKQS